MWLGYCEQKHNEYAQLKKYFIFYIKAVDLTQAIELIINIICFKMNTFLRVAGFCPDCGSVLPPLTDKGGINCYACPRKFAADAIDSKYLRALTI